MNRSTSSLLKFSSAAAVALVLGAAFAATPAAAAGPAFSFNLDMPGADVQMGAGNDWHHHRHMQPVCLSDDEVASELEDAGWRHVEVGDDLGHYRVLAYGNWHRDRTLYQMVVDRCSGDVSRVSAVRPNRPDRGGAGMYMHDDNSGMSFGFGVGN